MPATSFANTPPDRKYPWDDFFSSACRLVCWCNYFSGCWLLYHHTRHLRTFLSPVIKVKINIKWHRCCNASVYMAWTARYLLSVP